jgi:hypothetical protein
MTEATPAAWATPVAGADEGDEPDGPADPDPASAETTTTRNVNDDRTAIIRALRPGDRDRQCARVSGRDCPRRIA